MTTLFQINRKSIIAIAASSMMLLVPAMATQAGQYGKHYKKYGSHAHMLKHKRHHSQYRHGHHRHHAGKGYGHIKFGGWRKTRTEISCLRFNAKASGKNIHHASKRAKGALIKSMAVNIGGHFQHANVQSSGPSCSAVSSHKVTCVQTARYCF